MHGSELPTRITEVLDMIDNCKEMIRACEELATRIPDFTQECGQQIALEKSIIKQYQQEIQTCTTSSSN